MQPSPFDPGTLHTRLFHSGPVAMAITNPADGRFLDVNAAFANLVAVPSADLLADGDVAGRQFQFRLDGFPEDQALPREPAARSEGQLCTARGEFHEVLVSTQLVEWDGRQFLMHIIQDMTAIKQTEIVVRASQARFRLYFNAVPLPVFVYDAHTLEILDLNPAAVSQYGYTREELLALTMLDIRPPDERTKYLGLVQTLSSDMARFGIWIHQKKDSTTMPVDVTSYALELGGRVVRLAVCRDVGEQLRMEAALRASEERHRIIAEVTNDVLWDINFATNGIVFSEGMADVFGYTLTREEPVEWWLRHIHPAEREAVRVKFDAAIAGSDVDWTDTYRFLRRDGSYAHVRDRGHIFRDKDGAPARMVGAMIDITRQIEVQEAATQAALEERRRLARDLHDAITQSLYSLSLLAEVARRRAEQGDMAATTEGINRLGDLAQQSLKEMRLLVHELRPPLLQKEGLVAALQARLDTVERHSGVRARLVAQLDQTLSPQVQLHYYLVAEEALNNALKHAAASAVEVHLRSVHGAAANTLVMEISDNGKGFDPATINASGGMGLTNMRERMETLGGRLEVDSSPEKGTTIRVYVDIGDENHGKRNSDTDL